MADDIAALGFAVDSRPLKAVTDDLAKVSAAAGQTERATEKMSATVNRAAQSHKTATQQVHEQTNRVAAANDNLVRASGAASLALSRIGVNVPMMTAGLGVLGAIGVAIGVIGTNSVMAVAAYGRFEEHSLALNAMLKATGLSAGRTAEDIEKMVTEIGNVTEVRKAALELVKFGSIAGDVFDRTLVAADDLAAAGFGSISSAASALGKALESPAEGLTRLRRAGIIFSDVQIAMVKNMQETGRIADAQKFILDELAKKVGGAGAARDQGLAGSYEALSDATQRLLEHWGKQIASAINLAAAIRGIAAAIDNTIRSANDPAAKLAIVDESIEMARRVAAEQRQMGNIRGAERTETGINNALEQRRKLMREIAEETEKAARASEQANRAADAAEKQRRLDLLNGTVAAIGRETDALRKNAFQRAVLEQLKKAEINPDVPSPGRSAIERAVNTRMATEASEQALDAIRMQTESLKIEQATFGMSTSSAAAYRAEMEILAQQKIKGVTLSDELIASIRKEAQALGEVKQANERLTQAMEIGGAFVSGFFTDLSRGVNSADALRNALGRLSDTLIDMASRQLVAKALGGLLGSAGEFGGAANTGLISGGVSIAGGFASGGIVGADRVPLHFADPRMFVNAPQFAGGGMVDGGRPAIVHDGEGIFTKAQMAAMGRGGTTIKQDITFKIDGATSKQEIVTWISQGMAIAKKQAVAESNAGAPGRVNQFNNLGT